MKRAIPAMGVIAFLLVGWMAGRGMVGKTRESGMPVAPSRTPVGSFSIPRDFSKPGANGWLVALDAEQIAEWILRVSREPETRHRERRLTALFGRLFELDGTAAADLWLRIEGDCQPNLKDEVARWASMAPEEAAAWFSRSVDQLRRYRSGRLVVDLAEGIVSAIAETDPECAVRLLTENPAFYDSGVLFYLALELKMLREARLMEEVVAWAATQGADPANSLRTLSGFRIDASGDSFQFLASLDKDAALSLLDRLAPDDPRREGWRNDIRSGWSEHDTVAAMSWWVASRVPDQEWSETDIDPLMEWSRSRTDEWLPWMVDHVPAEVADRAMVKAINLTSPPALMHLRLCAAIRNDDLREATAAWIRSKGDPDELRAAAKGRPELEELLDTDSD